MCEPLFACHCDHWYHGIIIDDEVQIQRLLEITLSANGYRIIHAANGKDGMVEAASQHPALIILNLGLPDMDGQDILKQLREWYYKPIIVLSVRNAEEDIITALDCGANDYLTKPFRSGELLARIRAAIRSGEKKEDDQVLEFGALQIDMVSHVARKKASRKATSSGLFMVTNKVVVIMTPTP